MTKKTSAMTYVERLNSSPAFLTEGAVVTRLVYDYGLPTPESAAFVHLFSDAGRKALSAIYRSYLEVAAAYDLPMQVGTPTWRAHRDCLFRLGYTAPSDLHRANAESVALLQDLRRELGLEGTIFIAGVVGPRVDGYSPDGAPDADEAEDYVRDQVHALAGAGADLLYAPTFPDVEELVGVSRVFAETGLPYILAPVINADGRLPDGTALADAVARIDAAAARPPLYYMGGCVHPSHFEAAASKEPWPATDRIFGLQANASSLTPEELEGLDHADGSDPGEFAEMMVGLHRRGMKILGGCCGTNDMHMRALAGRLKASLVAS